MAGVKGASQRRALKRRILNDAEILNTLLYTTDIELKDIIYDIALAFLDDLYGKQKHINTLLRYLLNSIYSDAGNRKIIAEAFADFDVFSVFREWLAGNMLSRLDEDLACR
jgi:hypothetical protein